MRASLASGGGVEGLGGHGGADAKIASKYEEKQGFGPSEVQGFSREDDALDAERHVESLKV